MRKLICRIAETSFSNGIKTIFVDDENLGQFPVATVGHKSYIVDASIEANLYEGSTHLLIGNYCSIAHDVKFIINLNHYTCHATTYPLEKINSKWKSSELLPLKGQIVIGNDVWIGRGVTILDGVIIGNGAIIAANAVVTKSIPPYAVVAGNPGKIVKYRFHKEIVSKLNKIKWWYWEEKKMFENRSFFESDSLEGIEKLYQEAIENNNLQLVASVDFSGIKNKYLLVPDFDILYPAWEKVIRAFLDTFLIEDDVVLVLWIPKPKLYEKEISLIVQMVNEKKNAPIVCIEDQDNFKNEIQLLSQVNYYISNRDAESLKLIDYAFDMDITVISGMSVPIFKRGE